MPSSLIRFDAFKIVHMRLREGTGISCADNISVSYGQENYSSRKSYLYSNVTKRVDINYAQSSQAVTVNIGNVEQYSI